MIIWEVSYDPDGEPRRHFVPTSKEAREYRQELVRTVIVIDPSHPLRDEDGDTEYDEHGEPAYLERPIKPSEITISKIELWRAKGGRALVVEGMNYVEAT
jgi:hypothetical protein